MLKRIAAALIIILSVVAEGESAYDSLACCRQAKTV
jgi:hypothetical protein